MSFCGVIGGVFTNLGPGAGATSMNNAGQVVGTGSFSPTETIKAYVWSSGTGVVRLDSIADKAGLATAYSINQSGQIVGAAGLPRITIADTFLPTVSLRISARSAGPIACRMTSATPGLSSVPPIPRRSSHLMVLRT